MNDMNEINVTDTGSTKIAEKLKLSRVWLIVIIVVVVLALAAGAYFTFQYYKGKKSSTAANPGDTATTETAATTPVSASDIKSQMDEINVGQVKNTVTGVNNSVSMFNR